MRHLEDNLQMACFEWFNYQYAKYDGLLYHIANGGKRNKAEAARLKRMGVTPGIPDFHLAIARGKYHSLYIELKVGDNEPTEKQYEMHEKLRVQGHCVVTNWTLEEFIHTIENYLNL